MKWDDMVEIAPRNSHFKFKQCTKLGISSYAYLFTFLSIVSSNVWWWRVDSLDDFQSQCQLYNCMMTI